PTSQGEIKLPAAVGDSHNLDVNSGRYITQFASNIYHATDPHPHVIQGRVEEIRPGDLNHEIIYVDADGRERSLRAPLVVFGGGQGDPRSLDGKMQTSTPDSEGGLLWYKPITSEIAKAHPNWFINGAGNTGLATVRDLQRLRAQGIDVNYHLATHHSREAMMHPYDAIDGMSSYARTLDNLVGAELDMDMTRETLKRAFEEGRVITGVTGWDLLRPTREVVVHSKTPGIGTLRVPYDQLCNYIGSQHNPDTLARMGMLVGPSGEVLTGWTGAVVANPDADGFERYHRGLFAVGGPIQSKSYRNAPGIGGLMWQLERSAFAASQWAGEVVDRQRGIEVARESRRTTIPVSGIPKSATRDRSATSATSLERGTAPERPGVADTIVLGIKRLFSNDARAFTSNPSIEDVKRRTALAARQRKDNRRSVDPSN
ncbi:MAG: hypothetical protein ACREHC_08295, partial [Candidatus Levyibacteriota bacterium]